MLLSDRRRLINNSSSDILLESVMRNDPVESTDAQFHKLEKKVKSNRDLTESSLLSQQKQLQLLRKTVQDTAEEPFVASLVGHVTSAMRNQVKTIVLLEQELRYLQTCYNSRVEYFRQLQRISDTVQLQEYPNAEEVLVHHQDLEHEKNKRLPQLLARRKYIMYLLQDSLSPSKTSHDCLICTEPFSKGIMTPCGHVRFTLVRGLPWSPRC